jgi:hypothetical protein
MKTLLKISISRAFKISLDAASQSHGTRTAAAPGIGNSLSLSWPAEWDDGKEEEWSHMLR